MVKYTNHSEPASEVEWVWMLISILSGIGILVAGHVAWSRTPIISEFDISSMKLGYV